MELARRLGQLLRERQHRGRDRRERRIQPQQCPRLSVPEILHRVGLAEQREAGAVDPDGGLDHHRHEVILGLGIGHAEVLARVLRMPREVPVAPVVDALDLLPAKGEAELDVHGLLGVVRKLILGMGPRAQVLRAQAELRVEAQAFLEPVREPLLPLRGMAEELELGLLELPGAEREVARVDLVAEGLADLRDPEGDLLARRLPHALEVGEDRLAGLRAQIGQ